MLRSTWRGLKTWHGRDAVTLADERARDSGTQTSTYTGASALDPTDERDVETKGTARRKRRKQICSTYHRRATSRLYRFSSEGREKIISKSPTTAMPAP